VRVKGRVVRPAPFILTNDGPFCYPGFMKGYENLAKAIYDIGKYTFTALIVGQFVSERFNWIFMIGGFIFSILAFWIAIKIERIKEEDNG